MIAHLNGNLLFKSTQFVIIDNSGVGYEVTVPLSTFYSLPEKDERVNLHIYTHIREDAFNLFGFQTILEKKIFLLLISVSGIGPKLAVNILSGIGPDELLEAIAYGDAIRLQAIPGIGKKTAQRIALELKDKAAGIKGEQLPVGRDVVSEQKKQVLDDTISALLNLGYPAKSATISTEKAYAATGKEDLEGLIKEALRLLV